MPFYLVMPLVQIILFIVLIPITLKGRIRTGSRFLFVTLLVSLVAWSSFVLVMRATDDTVAAFGWGKWMAAARVWVVIAIFHFAVRYSGNKLPRWLLPFLYVVFSVFAVLSLFGLVISGVEPTEFGYAPEPGSLFLLISIPSFFMALMSFFYIYRSARQAIRSRERNRDVYFLIGLFCLSAGTSVSFLTLLDLDLYPGSFIGSIIFFLLSSYALITYRPADAQAVLRKGTTHLVIGIIVGLVYGGAMLIAYSAYGGALPLWLHALMLILLVLSLRLLWDKIQKIVDKLFYGNRYRSLLELRTFINDTHDVSDYNKIGNSLVSLIGRALQSRLVNLIMLSDTGEYTTIASSQEEQPPIVFGADSSLIQWLSSMKGVFLSRDIDLIPQLQTLTESERNMLKEKEIELIIPLKASMNDLAGIILIGKKRSAAIYTEEEINLLGQVAERVGIELENARLYHMQILIRDELQRQDELRTGFLHSVAHELKTPLTSLLSSAELLQEDIDSITVSQRDRIINNIQRSANSMDRRVTELLDFARARNETIKLVLEPASLETPLTTAIERMIPIFQDRQQTLTVDIQDSLPLVGADTDKIEQVILNLLSNASKYSSPESEIGIQARRANGDIVVDVMDSANIIDENDREKIFEPYYRGKTNNSDGRLPGLGLGLAISKQIVELHNGRIWVKSIPGKGNVFSFSIPVISDE
ncbi:MAG: hypothetical protein JW712_01830 [Dehalococcoidales bacterium]|nr:hypothetical protein [Dehalococcoidales bacterium]